jgi:hypothetical protein
MGQRVRDVADIAPQAQARCSLSEGLTLNRGGQARPDQFIDRLTQADVALLPQAPNCGSNVVIQRDRSTHG